MRKIAIVGAGAVGSTIGALLDRAREVVVLIGRKDHVSAIKRKGLIVDGIKGRLTAKVQAAEQLDFRPDLVLLTVKTQDVIPTLEAIKPYIEGVPVLTMQNGIRSDEMAAQVIGRELLVSAVVLMASNFLEPGLVSYVGAGRLLIGPPFPECRTPVEQFVNMLTKIMPTTVTSNIRGAHWTKLLGNLNNAIPAITGLEMSACFAHSLLRRTGIRLMREGAAVARAVGVTLEPLPGFPIPLLTLMTRLPLGLASSLFGIGLRRAQKMMTGLPTLGSVLQSIKRGKRTEIDYLNGEVVHYGKQLGISTPYNEKIVTLVHRVEETGQFLSPESLMTLMESQMTQIKKQDDTDPPPHPSA